MSLRSKAINGVLWNSTGNFSLLGIEFILGIILARVLTPSEFGLIGTIMVVIQLSEVFINSGFTQAIIRKQNCTQTDYSTAFFFNFATGILFFFILFFTAGPISRFFKNEELQPLIQVLGIGLIVSSLSLIQRAKLTQRIDFKLQTKISVISSLLSGIAAIAMAFLGFGVWSLVVKNLLKNGFNSIMLWIWNKWYPDFVFSRKSFKELFRFGSKLLISGLITTLLQNINYLIIAKYFTAQDLGYFTRAELFKNLPSKNVSTVVTTVGYPALATMQDDPVRLKRAFREMFTNTFFVISMLMAGMASSAKAMIITLVGSQWLPSVEYLQMLCIVGAMLPLITMNINILNVVGRSDLYLKLQLISQTFAIPNIFIGIFFGIKALILGMIILSFLNYIIFNHESNKVLNYPLKEQLKDIFPSFLLAIIMGFLVFSIEYFTSLNELITLLIQVTTGTVIVISAGEFMKMKEYLFIKTILLEKIRILKFRRN